MPSLRRRTNAKNRKRFNKELTEVPRPEWPQTAPPIPTRIWVSRSYLVQEFKEDSCIRISVNKVQVGVGGRFDDGISWEALQKIKRDVGYGESYAIEVFPRDCDIVNVANMRHLWILPKPLDIGWF